MAKRRRKARPAPEPKAKPHWLESLSEYEREQRLFPWMTKARDKAMASANRSRKLEAPSGAIAVGAGAFDPFLRGEGPQQYPSALGRGHDPAGALDYAQRWRREAVDTHNAKRPRDACWQRSQCSGSSALEALHRSLLREMRN